MQLESGPKEERLRKVAPAKSNPCALTTMGEEEACWLQGEG
jgi:hypothetical protein